MQVNDVSAVIVSARPFDFDGHMAYSVTERSTGRLIGHVARTANKVYGRKFGTWCYLGVTEQRGPWTIGGWTRAEGVDHLMSWWAPCGKFTATETDTRANVSLFR